MSRIATEILGAYFDPSDPNWSLFFKGDVNSAAFPAITGIGFPEAFATFRQIRTYAYDYNFDVTPSGGGGPINYADSGSTFKDGIATGDELELICAGIFSITLHFPTDDFAIGLCAYDTGSKLFSFGSSSVFASGLSLDPAVGGAATALDFTFLGHAATVYGSTGVASATGTFDITIVDYYAYDNGLSVLPSDGPVFDSATGTQLIVPAPIGF